MSGSSFTNVFGATPVSPANPSYSALTIAANTTLVWPIETTEGSPIVASLMDVTASTTSLSLTMPPGNTGSTGIATIIANVGANTFSVRDQGGNLIVSIPTTQVWIISLTSNSTVNGTWRALQLASTTSSATAASLAGQGLEANGSFLQVDASVTYLNTNTNITPSYRGETIIWTGGSGTLTLNSSATLGDGWYCFIGNYGSDQLLVYTSGGQTINGASYLYLAPDSSSIIVCGATNFNSIGNVISPLSIDGGGTGASDSSTALTNLGGTTVGKALFMAPSQGAARSILGITNSQWTESTVSTSQTLTTASTHTVFVCTSLLTLLLPLTTTLDVTYSFQAYAQNGVVTITPNALDNINGLGLGVSLTIPLKGCVQLVTDAANKWWALFGPEMSGATLVTTGGITAGGTIAATGIISAGTINATTILNTGSLAATQGTVSTAFNAGSIGASGTISAGGLLSGANINTGGTLAVTGAATAANLTTTGTITAATNITATQAIVATTTLTSLGGLVVGTTAAITGVASAANGTSSNALVNFSQFPQLLNPTSTYIGFPGSSGTGFYTQAGQGTTDGSGLATVTFPHAFGTSCVMCTPTAVDGATPYMAYLTAYPSATTALVKTVDMAGVAAATKTFGWIAVGY